MKLISKTYLDEETNLQVEISDDFDMITIKGQNDYPKNFCFKNSSHATVLKMCAFFWRVQNLFVVSQAKDAGLLK